MPNSREVSMLRQFAKVYNEWKTLDGAVDSGLREEVERRLLISGDEDGGMDREGGGGPETDANDDN